MGESSAPSESPGRSSAARSRRGDRRLGAVERAPLRVGGPPQLRAPARGLGGTDSLRTAPTKKSGTRLLGPRQSHISAVTSRSAGVTEPARGLRSNLSKSLTGSPRGSVGATSSSARGLAGDDPEGPRRGGTSQPAGQRLDPTARGARCASTRLAGRPTTVDDNPITFDDPRIAFVKTPIPRSLDGSFHAAFSISSFEHDGLGRYGDPIDPDADLKAMHRMKKLPRPDAFSSWPSPSDSTRSSSTRIGSTAASTYRCCSRAGPRSTRSDSTKLFSIATPATAGCPPVRSRRQRGSARSCCTPTTPSTARSSFFATTGRIANHGSPRKGRPWDRGRPRPVGSEALRRSGDPVTRVGERGDAPRGTAAA